MSDFFELIGELLSCAGQITLTQISLCIVILTILMLIIFSLCTWSFDIYFVGASLFICMLLYTPEIYRFIKSWII
ncbi:MULTISPECIES: hypothetical protein [Proteus]|uniref:Uncharacterized protein n=1 Tax=Proteus columbae TaxID=1987580 RepID=A0A6I7D7X8_9GAMM|nr:hypothetical protein [Proteus columbae]QHN10834.1 hypothetical protein F1325_10310 [Proteus columbae]